MTFGQAFTLGVLAGTLVMFVWGRVRYDLVAFGALILCTVAGVVPAGQAFLGFGHPAVITVAAVLVLSRGLGNSGAVDALARHLLPRAKNDLVFIGSFCVVAAVLSGFMNNVGALALLMPVAIRAAVETGRSPALILMPLSFASILGGLFTLIGTPPNIIIATFREQAAGAPFGMFDFTPVGGAAMIVGVVFVVVIGWRLIPKDRLKLAKGPEIFDIEDYIAEVRVPKTSAFVGTKLGDAETAAEAQNVAIVGLIRGKDRISLDRRRRVHARDILILEAAPESLGNAIKALGLELLSGGKVVDDLRSGDVTLAEAVVAPRSMLERRTPGQIQFRRRFRVNLLAVSRQGRPSRGRLRDFRFQAGDVVLLHGDVDHFPGVIARMGCLPLAERAVQIAPPQKAGLAILFFAAAIVAAALGLTSAPVAFGAAAVGMLAARILSASDVYDAIDWPIVILLAALIPIGGALETTGTTRLLAAGIVDLARGWGPLVLLALIMIVTMTLSDVINNAATAVVMAPIALSIAGRLHANPDAFLMAVAIGASCAFLTPIGHQNNTLVLGPGGYKFGDYWRVGLPLEIVIVVVSLPLLMLVFPL